MLGRPLHEHRNLWHHRPGQPSAASLLRLENSLFPFCNKSLRPRGACEACQLGHHARLPFRIQCHYYFYLSVSPLWYLDLSNCEFFQVSNIICSSWMTSRISPGVSLFAINLMLPPLSNDFTDMFSRNSMFLYNACNVITVASSWTFISAPSSLTVVLHYVSLAHTRLHKTARRNVPFDPPMTYSVCFFFKPTCQIPAGILHTCSNLGWPLVRRARNARSRVP